MILLALSENKYVKYSIKRVLGQKYYLYLVYYVAG
jgi:hypothetical protein